ncbi:MAG: hypothetical protein ACI81R_002112 [Bradymonadia bacterium]|jgi:uncharacterized protein YllA (UPF0747 family)
MTQRFGPAYAAGELTDSAAALLPAHFRTLAGREAVASLRRPLHLAVQAALREQNVALGPQSPERASALAKLDAPNLGCVVTGQQVGLFVGPLYSLWKAATAIVWAERLERESGAPVVPIFWLQSEDHDLPEIASCTVTDSRGGVHTTTLAPTTSKSAERASIAHATLGEDVVRVSARVSDLLSGLPHASEAIDAINETYRAGERWVDAFARLFGQVFANTSLLVLDPRTQELAALAAPIHRRAIGEHDAIVRCLSERGEALKQAGYDEQVPHRADSPLSFYHPSADDGNRYRLRPTKSEEGPDSENAATKSASTETSAPTQWTLADGAATPTDVSDAVHTALRQTPMRFSTSALLRPLVQDTLLPTLAYVGGPGELSYWAQLPPLYEHFGLPLPLVIPRASGMVVDGPTRDALSALGLTAVGPDRALPQTVGATLELLGPAEAVPSFDDLEVDVRAAIQDAMARARQEAESLDPSLANAFDKTEDNMMRGVEKLTRRLTKSMLHADSERNEHARLAGARLHPAGTPQDRTLCVPDLAARIGLQNIAPTLLDAIRASDLDTSHSLEAHV